MGLYTDKKGREVMDPRPAMPTIRRERMQSLSDQMRSVVQQMHFEALAAEEESEEDQRDFDVEDDKFPRSPHELFVETPEYDLLLSDIEEFKKKRAARLAGADEDGVIPDGSGDAEKSSKSKKAAAAPPDDVK